MALEVGIPMQTIVASPDPVEPGGYLTVCYDFGAFQGLDVLLAMKVKTAGGSEVVYKIPLDRDHPCYEPAIKLPEDAISIVIHDESGYSDDLTVTCLAV